MGHWVCPVGENMFQFSAAQKEKSMVVSLPYLERVEIRRRLPSTLVIRVEPAVETWCAQSDSGWLTLSDGLQDMAIGETQPEGLPLHCWGWILKLLWPVTI